MQSISPLCVCVQAKATFILLIICINCSKYYFRYDSCTYTIERTGLLNVILANDTCSSFKNRFNWLKWIYFNRRWTLIVMMFQPNLSFFIHCSKWIYEDGMDMKITSTAITYELSFSRLSLYQPYSNVFLQGLPKYMMPLQSLKKEKKHLFELYKENIKSRTHACTATSNGNSFYIFLGKKKRIYSLVKVKGKTYSNNWM